MKTFILGLAFLLLVGCASTSPYRIEAPSGQLCLYERAGDCAEQHHFLVGNKGTIHVLELDDQGRPAVELQLRRLLDTISDVKESTNILVFVHGWRHNAAPDDDNLEAFISLIDRFSKEVPQAKQTIGVYVGWRGRSVTLPWLDVLSFWDRKFTAHEIGERATDVFVEIDLAVDIRRAKFVAENAHCQSKSTWSRPSDCPFLSLHFLGHSFGGAMLASAMPSLLLFDAMTSRKGYQRINRNIAFDSVVLLNPAVEALMLLPMWQFMTAGGDCSPYLISLTSETDWATKYAFRAGRAINILLETHHPLEVTPEFIGQESESIEVDEADADRNAIGHYEPLQTHRLVPADEADRVEGCVDFAGQAHALNTLVANADNAGIWNVIVDESVMDGHGDIWGDSLQQALLHFLVTRTRAQQHLK